MKLNLNACIPVRLCLVLFLSFGSLFILKGEGSREAAPNANTVIQTNNGPETTNDIAALHIGNPIFNNFASFDNTNVNSRLHIHISDPLTENILLGFSQGHLNATSPNPPTIDFVYRILDPSGNIVFGPTRITGISANINNWAEAVAGPSQLVGPAGYDATQVNALDLTSGGWTTAGDYYIEFDNISGNDAILIDYWDITVVENSVNSLVEKKGRLWSFNWAMFAINDFGFPDRPFNGSFYVCAPDVLDPEAAFVTQIDFNNAGFRPAAFNIAFNSFGTLNTGDISSDRRSREDINSAIPEYAIFLNDPIDICRTAESGDISILGVSRCGNEDYCIKFVSTRSGQIDLLLDFDGQDDVFTPGTADIMISQLVNAGDVGQEICLPWDGRDGLGNMLVENTATQIPISLSFAQGIYHFPIYDAELMTNGFAINNVRPAGPEPLLFYDDSLIPDDSGSGEVKVQLMGCDLPCHRWTNFEQGTGNGMGNLNTINSWWFSQQTMNTEVLFLPSFYSCEITGPEVACEGEDVILELLTTFGPDVNNPADIENLSWTGPGIIGGNGSEAISINASGNYEATFNWENGTGDNCETVCAFDFILQESSSFIIDTLLEFDETLEVNSIIYDANGTYTQVLTAANGCDSILTIIVEVNMPEVMLGCILQGTTELCEGESGTLNLEITKTPFDAPDPEILDLSWTRNGTNIANDVLSVNVTEPGQYTTSITYANFEGDTITEICSIIVNVSPTYEIQIDTLIGEGEVIGIDGIIIAGPGQYIDNLVTQEGCDSIVIINVIQESSVLYYSLDDCQSSNYDLFVPEYPTPLDCAELNASIVYRANEELNRHSCTPGVDGGVGLCVSSVDDCNYLAGDEKSTIIDVVVIPGDQQAVQLTSLRFFERAPQEFQWIVGTEGLNNYPTQYGVRVLRNGQEVFRSIDIETTFDWTSEIFNFATLEDFKVQEPTVFRFEFLAYCLVGNESDVTAWDIDEISIQADCAEFVRNSVEVSGSISNTVQEPLENIQMDLNYGAFDFQKLTSTTDVNGLYAFDNVLKNKEYNLKPVSDDDYLNGVSTLDLIHIQRHILGIEQFDSPYKMIAADVDKSKSISVIDMLHLRKLILGVYDVLPQNNSWRFVESNQELPVSNPWNINENTDMLSLDNDRVQSFVGVKIGDVTEDNSSFQSNKDVDKRSAKSVALHTASQSLYTNQKTQVKLSFDNIERAMGFQMILKGEDVIFESVDNSDLVEGIDYVINNDRITFSVIANNDVVSSELLLTVTSLKNNLLSEVLSIDNSKLQPEVYTSYGEVANVEFEFINNKDIIQINEVRSYPNPFSADVQLEFESLHDQNLVIDFFDVTGRKILSKPVNANVGINTVTFTKGEFGEFNGLILYKVKMDDITLSGRMIKN